MKSHLIMTQNLTNKEICSKCKGKNCCQICGCALSPKDFKEPITEELLEKRLKEDIIFSCLPVSEETGYQVKIQGLYLNVLFIPRIKGIKDKDIYLAVKKVTDNPCIYWSEKEGCYFSDETRPFGGINVIPNQDRIHCYNLYEGTSKHKKDWKEYQTLIKNVLSKLNAL